MRLKRWVSGEKWTPNIIAFFILMTRVSNHNDKTRLYIYIYIHMHTHTHTHTCII